MARKSNTRAAHGAGSIRQRPDGTWEARFVTGHDPGSGKAVRKSVYAKTQKEVRQKLADYYAGQTLVHVADTTDTAKLYANVQAGKDTLELIVAGNDRQFTVTALFDNLGKGASGAAVQNMNLMLGFAETTGLNL